MADFICLAMASQYTENHGDVPPPPQQQQSGFRRSLGTSTLFGRRSSRSNTGSIARPTSDSSLIQTANTPQSVHIRIVPSIENPSRSLVFNIIERDLEVGRVIKIGRFTDRSSIQNHISFRSKVCSRAHAEIWLNSEGKVQLKDTKSSSGTFVNHVRLSAANTESRAVEIRDGDLVQLGVDYQGGFEEIYRSVKMRFEVTRLGQQQRNQPTAYSMSAFNNLRNLTSLQQTTATALDNHSTNSCQHQTKSEAEICAICLFPIRALQCLLTTPCSHTYHFKCLRPLMESYPGFQCPVCRTYSDLDADVEMEDDEVMEKPSPQESTTAMISNHVLSTITTNESQEQAEEESEQMLDTHSHVHPTSVANSLSEPSQSSTAPSELPLSTTLVSCSTCLSGILSSPSSSSPNDIAASNEHRQVSRDYLNNNAGDHRATIIFEDDNVINHLPQQQQQQVMTNTITTRNSNSIVDKIKMAFNEKRKRRHSQSPQNDSGSDEEIAYFDNNSPSSSSPPSSPRNNHYLQLSRQSTHQNALAEIIEEQPIVSGIVGNHSGF